MKRRRSKYIRPAITRIDLDSSITLVMMTVGNPDPRGDTRKSPSQDPFSSPFDSKPFG
ncbi:MAG: hypothetical protein LC649_11675 [Bacteroidales bacterium]|nr:hypothetical protein [Bacteroidales bacterium]